MTLGMKHVLSQQNWCLVLTCIKLLKRTHSTSSAHQSKYQAGLKLNIQDKSVCTFLMRLFLSHSMCDPDIWFIIILPSTFAEIVLCVTVDYHSTSGNRDFINMINGVSIQKRSKNIDNRRTLGHWEWYATKTVDT